jgi:hypothetical protein
VAFDEPHPVVEAFAGLCLQPRLADSRLARDDNDRSSPFDELAEGLLEAGELRLAADEGRRDRLDGRLPLTGH